MKALKDRARALRKNMTDAERVLWSHLRSRQLLDSKFRRQHPIGPFVVDFVCVEKKLVIELDGGQHSLTVDQDEKRSGYLRELGYRILRFWNNQVLKEMDSVIGVIASALKDTPPSPRPSPPQGRGGTERHPRGEGEQKDTPGERGNRKTPQGEGEQKDTPGERGNRKTPQGRGGIERHSGGKR